jgi:hypothetical protein
MILPRFPFVLCRDNSPLGIIIFNTELAIHALDQVHCWDAYFRLQIGHYENFTPLNFQPLLFSKQWRLVDRRCTLELLVAKKIMYKVPYSLKAV